MALTTHPDLTPTLKKKYSFPPLPPPGPKLTFDLFTHSHDVLAYVAATYSVYTKALFYVHLFYAVLFSLLLPIRFTPLLNLRSQIFGLTFFC